MSYKLNKIAAITAFLLTLLFALFLLQFALYAGALWRDEANTIAIASLPTLADLYKHLQFDSFPILWLLILRPLVTLGLATDEGLRTIGFLVGYTLIATLWLNTRLFRYRWPMISLTLLGLCPSVLIWGSSMRAYGFGMIAIMLMFPLIWNYVEKGTLKAWGAALFATLIGVHTIYYNSIVVFACIVGGSIVLLKQRDWTRAAFLSLIGFIAALTLLPYIPAFIGANDWNIVLRSPNYLPAEFWRKINETLAPAGTAVVWVWITLVIFAILSGIRLQFSTNTDFTDTERNQVLYALGTLLCMIPSHYFFLHWLSYPTQPWYYLALLAVLAISMDTIYGVLSKQSLFQSLRIGVALLLVCFTTKTVFYQVKVRMTNVDLLADTIQHSATNQDLIVINSWFYGMTFERYYHGTVQWDTIPPLPFHQFHRYDLIKKLMQSKNQKGIVVPILQNIESILKNGGKVYFVGPLYLMDGIELPDMLPAPNSRRGWSDAPYYTVWSNRVSIFILHHAKNAQYLDTPTTQRINDYEHLPMIILDGWKD